MNDIHAHEVLRMMEGNSYSTATLREAIIQRFGADQLFHTCSAKGLGVDALIEFLTAKGKFRPEADGFTVDLTKVCDEY